MTAPARLSSPLALTVHVLLNLASVAAVWTLVTLPNESGGPLLDLGGVDGFLIVTAGLFGIAWVFRLFVTDAAPAAWYFALLSLVIFLAAVGGLYARHPYVGGGSPGPRALAVVCGLSALVSLATIVHLAGRGARRRFDIS